MRIFERRSRRLGEATAPSESTAADTEQHSGVAAWQRRHAAKRRLLQLDCGCRDPWPCRCSEPPLSENAIDAGRDAALHLIAAGKTPLLEFEVLRALYRRGGRDRQLAEQLYAATGFEVA